MKKTIIFMVMVVCLLSFVSVMVSAQTRTTERWEYLIIKYDDKDTNQLNRLGGDGWELVQILEVRTGMSNNITGYNLVFKRKLP